MSIIGYCNLTGYDDNQVSPGTTYYYSVSAINSAGESQTSQSLKALTLTTLGDCSERVWPSTLRRIITLENGTSIRQTSQGDMSLLYSGAHELTVSGSGIQTIKVPVNAETQGSTIGPITTGADNSMATISTMILIVIAVAVVNIAIAVIAIYVSRRGK